MFGLFDCLIAEKAWSRALVQSDSDETLLMPTEEPSHGGFTTTGRGRGDFSVSGLASDHFAVGTFFISSTIFVFTLSIAICEAWTPGPV